MIKFHTQTNPAILLAKAGYQNNSKRVRVRNRFKNVIKPDGFIRPLTEDPKNNRFHCYAGITKDKKYLIDLHYDLVVSKTVYGHWVGKRFIPTHQGTAHRSWTMGNKVVVEKEKARILIIDEFLYYNGILNPKPQPIKKTWWQKLIQIFKHENTQSKNDKTTDRGKPV